MLGSRWACDFVADGEQLTNTFVVGAEVLGQKPDHVRDVEPICSEHLLDVRPVLAAVEEGLEDGKVVASEEGELPVGQLMLLEMKRRSEWNGVVSRKRSTGIPSNITRHWPEVINCAIPSLGGMISSGNASRTCCASVGGDEDVEIDVDCGPGFTRAPQQGEGSAERVRDPRRIETVVQLDDRIEDRPHRRVALCAPKIGYVSGPR